MVKTLKGGRKRAVVRGGGEEDGGRGEEGRGGGEKGEEQLSPWDPVGPIRQNRPRRPNIRGNGLLRAEPILHPGQATRRVSQ